MKNLFDFFMLQKYLFIGIINSIFSFLIYSFFIYIEIPYFYSLTLSTIISIIFNFFSYKNFLFNYDTSMFTFLKYLFNVLILFFINYCILLFLIDYLNYDPYLSQFIAICFLCILNWVILRSYVFLN